MGNSSAFGAESMQDQSGSAVPESIASIRGRMKAVIEPNTDPKRRFKQLEDRTGIKAESWTSVWHERQRPTEEMIQHIARLWPQHAYWLVMGALPDPEMVHKPPPKVHSVLVPHGSIVKVVQRTSST